MDPSGDLSDFDRGQIVMARRLGQSVSETARLVGCSRSAVTMSSKEKGKFEDMAKRDKISCNREIKNHIPPKGQKKKRIKDPNAPKRPPYVQVDLQNLPAILEVKSEHPGMSIGDTTKKLGEMWNSSSAEEKKPYEKKAATLKEKYDKGIVDTSSSAADDDDDDDDEEEEGDDE